MTDEQLLIKAIGEDPADDTTLLVYADWLQEHGDCDRDRATEEYIRLSVKYPCLRRTKKARRRPQPAVPAQLSAVALRWLAAEAAADEALDRLHAREISPCRKKVAEWVHFNWRRLVPGLLDAYPKMTGLKFHFGLIRFRLTIPASGSDYNCHCALWFDRGFLRDASFFGSFARDRVRQMTDNDQPLARFLCVGHG